MITLNIHNQSSHDIQFTPGLYHVYVSGNYTVRIQNSVQLTVKRSRLLSFIGPSYAFKLLLLLSAFLPTFSFSQNNYSEPKDSFDLYLNARRVPFSDTLSVEELLWSKWYAKSVMNKSTYCYLLGYDLVGNGIILHTKPTLKKEAFEPFLNDSVQHIQLTNFRIGSLSDTIVMTDTLLLSLDDLYKKNCFFDKHILLTIDDKYLSKKKNLRMKKLNLNESCNYLRFSLSGSVNQVSIYDENGRQLELIHVYGNQSGMISVDGYLGKYRVDIFGDCGNYSFVLEME